MKAKAKTAIAIVSIVLITRRRTLLQRETARETGEMTKQTKAKTMEVEGVTGLEMVIDHYLFWWIGQKDVNKQIFLIAISYLLDWWNA